MGMFQESRDRQYEKSGERIDNEVDETEWEPPQTGI